MDFINLPTEETVNGVRKNRKFCRLWGKNREVRQSVAGKYREIHQSFAGKYHEVHQIVARNFC